MKVFREIRHKLITTNALRKYLMYAFGEILLVVIGILFALQINNWNEQRKRNILESEFYCRLLEDVDLDISQTDARIEDAQERVKASNQAVRLLLQDDSPLIEVGQQIALSIKAIYNDFRLNNSAFEELKSGANLNIIKNKAVVKALNSYFNKTEAIRSVINVNGKNAVDIYFAHDDSFANGKTQASMLYGRFKYGMEKDVFEAISIDTTRLVSDNIKNRLFNEALRYMSANTRQLELYKQIKAESLLLQEILKENC